MKLITKYRSVIYTFLVALLFATYPLSLAANSIAMGLIIAFYFLDHKINIKQKINSSLKNKFVWLSVMYCIVQFVGLLYTDKTIFGLKQATHSLPFIILPVIALSEKIKKDHFIKLQEFIKYWTLAIMIYFICYHLFIVKRSINSIVDFTINEISSTSQLFPSALILISVVIIINQILKNKNRVLNSLIFLFLVYCLLILSSRIAIATFILSTVIIIYNSFKSISTYKRTALIFTSLLFLAVSIYNVSRIKQKIDVFYKTIDFDIDVILTKNSITRTKNTVEHRILIYYVATKAITTALPFGYGTGDYQEALNNGYNDINFKTGIDEKFNTHNQFLEEFLKTGILGGIITLALAIAILKFIRIQNSLVLSMVILAFLAMFFDSFLSRQHGVLYVAFFIPFLFLNNQYNNNSVLK